MPFKDPEKDKAYHKEYSRVHAKEKAEKTRKWVRENPDKKKAWDLKQLGWTLELWKFAYTLQDGKCGICKQVLIKPYADHKHVEPPIPRELLCASCNMGIGQFKDSPDLLDAAANYLRKHGEK